jgi:translation initiation factor 2B subunit (eIF-2B alpha/beta/delta family)
VQKLHPAVLEAGIACADRAVTGATARTAAMLAALKRAIQDYTPPDGSAFGRALAAYVNASVAFLWTDCRPPCVPQRNAVKWLKGLLSTVRF